MTFLWVEVWPSKSSCCHDTPTPQIFFTTLYFKKVSSSPNYKHNSMSCKISSSMKKIRELPWLDILLKMICHNWVAKVHGLNNYTIITCNQQVQLSVCLTWLFMHSLGFNQVSEKNKLSIYIFPHNQMIVAILNIWSTKNMLQKN